MYEGRPFDWQTVHLAAIKAERALWAMGMETQPVCPSGSYGLRTLDTGLMHGPEAR